MYQYTPPYPVPVHHFRNCPNHLIVHLPEELETFLSGGFHPKERRELYRLTVQRRISCPRDRQHL